MVTAEFQPTTEISMEPGDPPHQATDSRGSAVDVKVAYQEYADALRWFLLGVLKDDALVADTMQTTFMKLIQRGKSLRDQSSMKSWLFQVAFNEAMLVKRKNKVARKHSQQVAWRASAIRDGECAPERAAVRQEEIKQVRKALESLSAPQLAVVQKRIYDGLKFREIAAELDVPLGTVLARMQAALKKLRPFLE